MYDENVEISFFEFCLSRFVCRCLFLQRQVHRDERLSMNFCTMINFHFSRLIVNRKLGQESLSEIESEIFLGGILVGARAEIHHRH